MDLLSVEGSWGTGDARSGVCCAGRSGLRHKSGARSSVILSYRALWCDLCGEARRKSIYEHFVAVWPEKLWVSVVKDELWSSKVASRLRLRSNRKGPHVTFHLHDGSWIVVASTDLSGRKFPEDGVFMRKGDLLEQLDKILSRCSKWLTGTDIWRPSQKDSEPVRSKESDWKKTGEIFSGKVERRAWRIVKELAMERFDADVRPGEPPSPPMTDSDMDDLWAEGLDRARAEEKEGKR